MAKGKLEEKKPSPAEIAVNRFLDRKEEMDAFLSDPDVRPILEEYHQLVEEFNTALDAAIRSAKAQLRTSDGNKLVFAPIGVQKSFKRGYDVERLSRTLPADQFELVAEERVVYDLDVATLEQMARQGEVDQEIVNAAYNESEQNPRNMPGTPKPFNMPPLPVRD